MQKFQNLQQRAAVGPESNQLKVRAKSILRIIVSKPIQVGKMFCSSHPKLLRYATGYISDNTKMLWSKFLL